MSMLALIRPDDVNLALTFHVLGAMVMLGGLVTAATAGVTGWRAEPGTLSRLTYKTLLLVAFPGFVVMRIAAQWVYEEENIGAGGEDPTWVGIGYVTSDVGGIVLLISLVVAGIGLRRGRAGGLLKSVTVISLLLTLMYLVAVWAMSAKPT
jgi:hypothetical protein